MFIETAAVGGAPQRGAMSSISDHKRLGVILRCQGRHCTPDGVRSQRRELNL